MSSLRTSLAIVLVTATALAGCVRTPTGSFLVSAEFSDAPRAPLKDRLVLLPVRVQAVEVDATGTAYPEPAAARELAETLEAELRAVAREMEWLTLTELPQLNDRERQSLEQHLRLLRVVSLTAAGAQLSRDGKWNAVVAGLDYSIGDGLAFLRARTGARRALMVNGGLATSTDGRVAANVVAAFLPSLLVPGMVFVPLGPFSNSQLVAAVVDLETGELLWLHPGDGRYRRQVDMTSNRGARRSIRAMLGAPYERHNPMGEMN